MVPLKCVEIENEMLWFNRLQSLWFIDPHFFKSVLKQKADARMNTERLNTLHSLKLN